MSRKPVKVTPPAPSPASVPTVGPGRYTVHRFLSNCSEVSREYLLQNWKEGNQLMADEVPVDALPPVVILAAYARDYSVDLVDDYVILLDRYWDNVAHCFHPDKYFSSCIVILDETGQSPTERAYEDINVPEIYEELFP